MKQMKLKKILILFALLVAISTSVFFIIQRFNKKEVSFLTSFY